MMNTNATTPEIQTTRETRKNLRIYLDGVKTLNVDRVSTTFDAVYEIHPVTNQPFKLISKKQISQEVKPKSFNLTEVTAEEIARYRSHGIPSFVLKVDDKLYHAIIPRNLSFLSSNMLGAHKCSVPKKECRHLSAASDEQGGCAKVRNNAQYIERYPWITLGYESFNTDLDAFVVANCLHYEKCPPRKKFSKEELDRIKLSLAQFFWDEV